MATMQPWPMSLPRPAPTMRCTWQSRLDMRRAIDATLTSWMAARTAWRPMRCPG